jgi:hypothetical protein
MPVRHGIIHVEGDLGMDRALIARSPDQAHRFVQRQGSLGTSNM